MPDLNGIELEAVYRGDPRAVGDAIRVLRQALADPQMVTTDRLVVPGSAESFPVQNERGTTIATIPGQWQDYATTWAAAGGGASVGNGSLLSRYRQVGDHIDVWIRLEFGSTTAAGTGAWSFTTPVGIGTNKEIAGSCQALEFGVGRWALGVVTNSAGAAVFPWVSGTANPVLSTTPFTWGTSDMLAISISYEAQ